VVGLLNTGAWAELAAISTARLAPTPDAVSDAQAATLPTAGLTALRALEVGGLLLAKRVLVTGANGGVGRFAIQLGRESGAHVSALVRNAAAARALLRRLGATDVIEIVTGEFDLIVDAVEVPRSASPSSTAPRVASSSTSRHADGRRATGPHDRARSVVASSFPSDQRLPGTTHRRQGSTPRRLS
jgi:D-arabinose 1-dehydrogenase-like Zn-dependent alcohol dehydrogenase